MSNKVLNRFVFLGFVIITVLTFIQWKSRKSSIASGNSYTIKQTWNLPKELNEISGISWLRDDLVTCVQDELGVIFIYDLAAKQIVNSIDFAEPGDYEGIAIHENDAFVLRSDGVIFQVENFESNSRRTSQFKTAFSKKNNMESIALNKLNSSLMIAPKDKGLKSTNDKGLYEIPIESKRMNVSPSFKISINDPVLESFQSKKITNTFSPSDLAIHPKTQLIYVLDGRGSTLVVLNKQGEIERVYMLDKKVFNQPEAITFDESGRLFIGNEGKGDNATIVEVELK